MPELQCAVCTIGPPPSGYGQTLSLSTLAWPQRFLLLSRFSILTKALYRIVVITFRC